MKFIHITALVAALSFSGGAFAEDAPPARVTPVIGSGTSDTMRITKAVGNIDITDSQGNVTHLKPGDPIPDIRDSGATFTASATSGLELQIGGKTVRAPAGSSFRVSVDSSGAVHVASVSGPVGIRTEDGHNVTVASGGEVKTETNSEGKETITAETGTVVVSDKSGGNEVTLDKNNTTTEVSATFDASASTASNPLEAITEKVKASVSENTDTYTQSDLAVESGVVSESNP